MHEYFLKSKRIGFSLWNENDIELALSLWGQPEVSEFISASGIFSEDDIKKRLNTELNLYKDYQIQYYPIFNLDNDELIGCCGLRPFENQLDPLEIGFHIRKEYWNQGYASEAANAMIDYSFNDLKVKELKAGHNPNNIKSKNLLVKLGFTYENENYYEPTGLYHPTYYLKNKYI